MAYDNRFVVRLDVAQKRIVGGPMASISLINQILKIIEAERNLFCIGFFIQREQLRVIWFSFLSVVFLVDLNGLEEVIVKPLLYPFLECCSKHISQGI